MLLQVLGFACTLLVGITLGVIGGGGSILTVPILVYLFGIETSEYAPAYSLFIVGMTSLVGGGQKFYEGYVDLVTFVVFGIPSIISVYVTRHILVPAIPDTLILFGGKVELSKRTIVMGLFSNLMILASLSMICSKPTQKNNKTMKSTGDIEKEAYDKLHDSNTEMIELTNEVDGTDYEDFQLSSTVKTDEESSATQNDMYTDKESSANASFWTKASNYNYPLIIVEGFIVGIVTGLVGAGGGFLIIPALVHLSGLTMKRAVGTSLWIIGAKSLGGFLGDVQRLDFEWIFLFVLTTLAVLGILIGNFMSKFVNGDSLKKIFGWFVLIMGFTILIAELS